VSSSDDKAAIDSNWIFDGVSGQRGNGKRGTAPCGHPGTHVTNNFVTCDYRCEFSDGVPEHVRPERTTPICRLDGCEGGGRVIKWPDEWSRDGKDFWMCEACGGSFYA